jgi:hypothetical protein
MSSCGLKPAPQSDSGFEMFAAPVADMRKIASKMALPTGGECEMFLPQP